jgi:hypothetical protein
MPVPVNPMNRHRGLAVSTGLLGAILFSFFSFVRYALGIASMVLLLPAVIAYIAFGVGRLYYVHSSEHRPIQVLAATMVGMGASIMLSILIPIMMGLSIAGIGLYLGITSPIKGYQIGYNENFMTLLSKSLALLYKNWVFVHGPFLWLAPSLMEDMPAPAEDTYQRVLALSAQEEQGPNREVAVLFERCKLEDELFDLLCAISKSLIPFTPEERVQLDGGIGGPKWGTYKSLERLQTEECPITTERPLPENTILFVQQYLDRGEWKVVPNSSHIFDKASLRGLLARDDPKHPLRGDLILSPNNYKNEGCTYQTRYRWHPFYSGPGCTGLSQEMNELHASLRELLPAAQPASSMAFDAVEPTVPPIHPVQAF